MFPSVLSLCSHTCKIPLQHYLYNCSLEMWMQKAARAFGKTGKNHSYNRSERGMGHDGKTPFYYSVLKAGFSSEVYVLLLITPCWLMRPHWLHEWKDRILWDKNVDYWFSQGRQGKLVQSNPKQENRMTCITRKLAEAVLGVVVHAAINSDLPTCTLLHKSWPYSKSQLYWCNLDKIKHHTFSCS